ncbi:hypothetical protein [Micromonospora chersina]|uniref:hypothetical protein n=1 Tax=Micromonospora chersina TaxID=47854 RepID=UPI003723A842
MTQTQSRPAGNGAAAEQVGETSSHATHLPAAWHEQAEWEGSWHYAEGYAAGWAAAEQAIADEITRAIGVKPYDRRDVIRELIGGIGQVREPYSSTANGTTLGVAERDAIGRRAA